MPLPGFAKRQSVSAFCLCLAAGPASAGTCPPQARIEQSALGTGVQYLATWEGGAWGGIDPLGRVEPSANISFKDVYISARESSVICYYSSKENDVFKLVLKRVAGVAKADTAWKTVKQADGSELLWCSEANPQDCRFE